MPAKDRKPNINTRPLLSVELLRSVPFLMIHDHHIRGLLPLDSTSVLSSYPRNMMLENYPTPDNLEKQSPGWMNTEKHGTPTDVLGIKSRLFHAVNILRTASMRAFQAQMGVQHSVHHPPPKPAH